MDGPPGDTAAVSVIPTAAGDVLAVSADIPVPRSDDPPPPQGKDFHWGEETRHQEIAVVATMATLKVHMHEIFIVCFSTFFCIFQSLIDLIDTKRSTANIFENIFKIRTDIQSFR